MPIARALNCAALSHDMTDFEDGARLAPPGVHDDAKVLSDIIADVFVHLKTALAAADIGLTVPNDDRYRQFEAALYGMLREGNPDSTLFERTERFGRALSGPAGARYLPPAGAFLRDQGLLPAENFG